jgi:hypothetical protein
MEKAFTMMKEIKKTSQRGQKRIQKLLRRLGMIWECSKTSSVWRQPGQLTPATANVVGTLVSGRVRWRVLEAVWKVENLDCWSLGTPLEGCRHADAMEGIGCGTGY